MGCHTWGYKKISALSEEYKNELVQDKIKEEENIWFFTASEEEVIKRTNEIYKGYANEGYEKFSKGYTEKDYLRDYKKYKNQIARLASEGFDYLIKLEKDSAKIHKGKGEIYWNITFDKPFRVYGYPENTFYSREKLLKWLKSTKNIIGYYDENNRWQEGYSEELINSINDFYKEHGEDNLYFEFG